jgi:hypothetical protein
MTRKSRVHPMGAKRKHDNPLHNYILRQVQGVLSCIQYDHPEYELHERLATSISCRLTGHLRDRMGAMIDAYVKEDLA